jgi:hypothetical protein
VNITRKPVAPISFEFSTINFTLPFNLIHISFITTLKAIKQTATPDLASALPNPYGRNREMLSSPPLQMGSSR